MDEVAQNSSHQTEDSHAESENSIPVEDALVRIVVTRIQVDLFWKGERVDYNKETLVGWTERKGVGCSVRGTT